MVSGAIEQKASQLLTCGMRQTNRSHFGDRGMIGFTELLRHAHCRLAVLAQEAQEILPRDEIRLCRFDYIGWQLIWFLWDRGRQTQALSPFRDPQNESPPIGRRG